MRVWCGRAGDVNGGAMVPLAEQEGGHAEVGAEGKSGLRAHLRTGGWGLGDEHDRWQPFLVEGLPAQVVQVGHGVLVEDAAAVQ